MSKVAGPTDVSVFIKAARKAMGLTLAAFGERFGRTKANVHGWEQGLHEPAFAMLAEMAAASGVPLPRSAATLPGNPDQSTKQPPSVERTRTGVSQAQTVSQPEPKVIPPVVTESDVVTGNVGESFCLLVADASGGDEFPRGSFIIWSKTRRPDIGRVILVKDRFDKLHIRRKRQGQTPQTWVAAPLHPDFNALDSLHDALDLMGVKDGSIDRPDD